MADNEFLTGYLSGQNEGGSNKGGMFGNGWEGIIGLIVILALLGGGFGMGGLFGGARGGNPATQTDVREAIDQQTLTSKIDQQTYGMATSFNALNGALTSGFHGVDNALCALGHQLSDCCCTTQRAIDGVNYNIATQTAAVQSSLATSTRDIIESQNAGTRAVLDFLAQEKLATQAARISQLENQIALSNQTALFRADLDASRAEILRRTGHDCPTAAYLVQPPTPVNFPVNGCGTVQWGGYNACGCCA